MLAKISFVAFTLAVLIQISTQQTTSCTCAALDACMQPAKTQMNNCRTTCRTQQLKTIGAAQCFTTQEAAMDVLGECMKPCTSRKRRQNPPPFGGGGGGGGDGGFGGPGGHGGGPQPGGFGRSPWTLSGNAATEINGYHDCIKTCLQSATQTTNCFQQLRCSRPTGNKNCQPPSSSTLCTCLSGVYGNGVTCQQQNQQQG